MNSITKALTFCGLATLLASVGTAASAQDIHHHHHHHAGAHHAIARQKAKYARAVAHGNYAAAERAHLRAKAVRHNVRVHKHEWHKDH